jgi:hypothetical protein
MRAIVLWRDSFIEMRMASNSAVRVHRLELVVPARVVGMPWVLTTTTGKR